MKITFDTNVIISALYSKRGASYRLLSACLAGGLEYAVSPLVALEYEGKIYQKIDEGFLKIRRKDITKILDAFFAFAVIVWDPVRIRPVLSDPSDDKILECAISGHCTHIITFNKKHFPLGLIRLYGVVAIPPGEFLKIWRKKP